MKYNEIKAYYMQLYHKYNEDCAKLTSINRPKYIKDFTDKYNANISYYDITFRSPIFLEDIVTVQNVTHENIVIQGFWISKRIECFCISTQELSFYTRSQEAQLLNVGDQIRIHGNVSAKLSTYDGIYFSIVPTENFSIEFTKI